MCGDGISLVYNWGIHIFPVQLFLSKVCLPVAFVQIKAHKYTSVIKQNTVERRKWS